MLFCAWAVDWAGLPVCTALLPLQVCLEGEISRQSILNSLSRGKKASGDLIPWTVSEQVMRSPWPVGVSEAGPVGGCVSLSCWLVSPTQFQDPDFGGLSGGRVVRIAVHPDYQGVPCPPSSQQLCCGLVRAGVGGCVNGKLVEEHAVQALLCCGVCRLGPGGRGRTDRQDDCMSSLFLCCEDRGPENQIFL